MPHEIIYGISKLLSAVFDENYDLWPDGILQNSIVLQCLSLQSNYFANQLIAYSQALNSASVWQNSAIFFSQGICCFEFLSFFVKDFFIKCIVLANRTMAFSSLSKTSNNPKVI